MAGLATLAASMGFPPVDACGPTHGAGPIIALELVRSPAELAELFGPPSCAEQFRAAQFATSWWDAIAFIPAYALFLILGAAALRPQPRQLRLNALPRHGLAWNAMGAMGGAAILDAFEGLLLFQLLQAAPQGTGTFEVLIFVVRGKFALLALGEILLAILAWRGTAIGKVGAVVLAAGGLVSLWFLFNDPHDPAMMLGHRYAWMALLALAFTGSIKREWVKRT